MTNTTETYLFTGQTIGITEHCPICCSILFYLDLCLKLKKKVKKHTVLIDTTQCCLIMLLCYHIVTNSSGITTSYVIYNSMCNTMHLNLVRTRLCALDSVGYHDFVFTFPGQAGKLFIFALK